MCTRVFLRPLKMWKMYHVAPTVKCLETPALKEATGLDLHELSRAVEDILENAHSSSWHMLEAT